MKKVTINVKNNTNNKSFATNCYKGKTECCPVRVFSINLSKLANITVCNQRTEAENIVTLTCDGENNAKELFMAVHTLCDTCRHAASNKTRS